MTESKPTQTRTTITDRDNLNVGDQIAVPFKVIGSQEAEHHGIVARGEDGYAVKVISFTSSMKKGVDVGEVIIQDLAKFDEGQDITVITYDPEKFTSEEVVDRAKKFLDGEWSMGDYNYLTNNCEHFVTFIKTGVKESKQTGKAAEVVNQCSCCIL